MKPSEYTANHYASYGQMETPNSKLEYMELDEFLRENGIQGQEPTEYQLSPWLQQQQMQHQQHQHHQQQLHHQQQQQQQNQQQNQQQQLPPQHNQSMLPNQQMQPNLPNPAQNQAQTNGQHPIGPQSMYPARQHPYQRYQQPTPTPSTPNTPTDGTYPYNTATPNGFHGQTYHNNQVPAENETALLALDAFTAHHHHSPVNTQSSNPHRTPQHISHSHQPHNPNSKRVARSPVIVAGNAMLSPPSTPISPNGQAYSTGVASPDSQHRQLQAPLSVHMCHSINSAATSGGQMTTRQSPLPSMNSCPDEDSASSCSSQSPHERLQGSPQQNGVGENQRLHGSIHNSNSSDSSAVPTSVLPPGTNMQDNCPSDDQISLSKVKTEVLDEDPDLQDFYGILGKKDFNPKTRNFACSELKPQPMLKKAIKVFVPEERKDNRYWTRRRKNNISAKRSRDARRSKENQIVLRASFLEQENNTLRDQLEKALTRLSRYETIDSSLSPAPPTLPPIID